MATGHDEPEDRVFYRGEFVAPDALYAEAINFWGFDAQVSMLQEEATELAVAVSHLHRGRPGSAAEFAEEIADVEIMIAQVKRNEHLRREIRKQRAQKLERLARRLEKARQSRGGGGG